MAKVGTFSAKLGRIEELADMLDADGVVVRPKTGDAGDLSAVVGWGRKKSSVKAQKYCEKHGVPFVALEDGLLRSLLLPNEHPNPLSIVVDRTGIYYDSSRPSDLENILNAEGLVGTLQDHNLIKIALKLILENNLGKYNCFNDIDPCFFGRHNRSRILVVDQTAGDLSIGSGGATEKTFDEMLRAALNENPDSEIYLKIHPEALSGDKEAHLTKYMQDQRVRVVPHNTSAMSILKKMDKVYVVTSTTGFEALIAGCEVICFGQPFYAGWGLTEDRMPINRRLKSRTIEELAIAVFLKYTRYRLKKAHYGCHPLIATIHRLAQQRNWIKANKRRVVGLGFSKWKHKFIPAFLPGNKAISFPDGITEASYQQSCSYIRWGVKDVSIEPEVAPKVDIISVEDGFLRSPQLGSDLTRPWSLIFDQSGIYFDGRVPSDLERILSLFRFNEQYIARAKHVVNMVKALRVTKYNLSHSTPLERPEGENRYILIVGQVEDDASILTSTGQIKTNDQLIKHVCKEHPEAYIVFKPHPDVMSGNRAGKISTEASHMLDDIEKNASLPDCLDVCDEVHTISSLVGFEALLRDKKVVTYGSPFYAGWGLTEDYGLNADILKRRTRVLSKEELVAGALLIYPRYYDWDLKEPSDCETTIVKLHERIGAAEHLRAKSFFARMYYKLKRLAGF